MLHIRYRGRVRSTSEGVSVYSLILARSLVAVSNGSGKTSGRNILVIAEKGVLFLADFDGAAAELSTLLARCSSCSPTCLFDGATRCASPLIKHPGRISTYLRNQNLVTWLHTRRDPLSLLIQRTRANSQYLRLVQFLDGALGEKDAGSGLSLGLHALDEDAVQKGSDGADGLDGRLVELALADCAP